MHTVALVQVVEPKPRDQKMVVVESEPKWNRA